ncbi:hypothetical protein B0H14DRAFT_2357784, partial [Mycena olivaceomarginata]
QEFRLPARTIRSVFASNPLDSTSHESTPPPATQTVPARDVFHNVQAAIRPLIAGIQTREQVADLIHNLEGLQYSTKHRRGSPRSNHQSTGHSHKGRLRTARLTNAREGRHRGGGVPARRPTVVAVEDVSGPSAKKSRAGRSYKCSLCRQEGHNRAKCPLQS